MSKWLCDPNVGSRPNFPPKVYPYRPKQSSDLEVGEDLSGCGRDHDSGGEVLNDGLQPNAGPASERGKRSDPQRRQAFGKLGTFDRFLSRAQHFVGPVVRMEIKGLDPALEIQGGYLPPLEPARDATDGRFRLAVELEF